MNSTVRWLKKMLIWVWPLYWLVPFFALNDWFYFFIALTGPVLGIMLGLFDTIIFKIKRRGEQWDMVKMLHRYRYEFLKNREVGIPRIDRTEERGGYE